MSDDEAKEEKELYLSSPDDVTKYKLAAEIANKALQVVIAECKPGAKVADLCEKGDSFIKEQTTNACRNSKSKFDKGIAFPTCVSLVCHFSPLTSGDITVSNNDTVKIDLGCHIDGFIAVIAHTHVVQEVQTNGRRADVLAAINTGADVALRLIRPGKKDRFDPSDLPRKLEDCAVALDMGRRSYHTATTVGNNIVVFGGIRPRELSNDVCIFDTISSKWISPEVLGTPPSPRCGHSAILLNEERILIFGGDSILSEDMIWFLEVDTPFVRQKRQSLGKDVVAWSKGYIGNMPQPVVICGPSGVGKGTLINRLVKDFPAVFGFSVSHTTRLPREREMSGVHYHFIDRQKMELAIQEGKFLESANVHGNLYGTSISAVEAVADVGKRCILDIDVQGAQAVKKNGLDALFIFIAPPSLEQLESRLRGRGTETEEQIQRRMKNAKLELEQGKTLSLFDHYVVNDDLEKCYLDLKRLLGLDGNNSHSTQNGFQETGELHPRAGHSMSHIEPYVYIYGGTTNGITANAIIILETSQIKGGAPGRTTGLRLSGLESKA